MSYNPNSNVMLDLDNTGTNPDNLIEDEVHTLSNKLLRSITPKLGPFYGSSVRLINGGTVLVRGQDYQLVELNQDATLRLGKEIYSVILIISPSVTNEVQVTYQALGGYYSLTGTNNVIGRLYETVTNDNRAINWDNIFNKPNEFVPTNHRHLFEDVYGFEPVVDLLERIKRAITMGQTGVLLEASRALFKKPPVEELRVTLPTTSFLQYDALLYYLSNRKMLSDVHVDTAYYDWNRGMNHTFYIDTSSIQPGLDVFWEIYKEGGSPIVTITQNKGVVKSNGSRVYISIYLPATEESYERNFYIGVKYSPTEEEFRGVTYLINTFNPVLTSNMEGVYFESPEDMNIMTRNPHFFTDSEEMALFYMLRNH